MDIDTVMHSLAQKRPLFHSEKDFQHALAWEIHMRDPSLKIRLEVPRKLQYRHLPWPSHIDLTVDEGKRRTWLELKYDTAELCVSVGGEDFILKHQAAVADVRYNFWQDVERLEQVCLLERGKENIGFAVFLTNLPAFWRNEGGGRAKDERFRLVDGRRYEGRLRWPPYIDHGKRQSASFLTLRGKYRSKWADYSRLNGEGPTLFRYFCVQVK